jgi:hypothetical protein
LDNTCLFKLTVFDHSSDFYVLFFLGESVVAATALTSATARRLPTPTASTAEAELTDRTADKFQVKKLDHFLHQITECFLTLNTNKI